MKKKIILLSYSHYLINANFENKIIYKKEFKISLTALIYSLNTYIEHFLQILNNFIDKLR